MPHLHVWWLHGAPFLSRHRRHRYDDPLCKMHGTPTRAQPPHAYALLWLTSFSHFTGFFNAPTLINAGKVLSSMFFLRACLTAFFMPGWCSFSPIKSVLGTLTMAWVGGAATMPVRRGTKYAALALTAASYTAALPQRPIPQHYRSVLYRSTTAAHIPTVAHIPKALARTNGVDAVVRSA